MMIAVLALVQADPVADLDSELLASSTATAVLERRCGAPIRAEVERGATAPEPEGLRARLRAGPDEAVAYRRVWLYCGHELLSGAQNWYLPGRLTAEMNAALAGDAPFGAVIRPLAPRRRTLAHAPLARSEAVLRHRALVFDGAGRPLAEVIESYTAEALLTRPS